MEIRSGPEQPIQKKRNEISKFTDIVKNHTTVKDAEIIIQLKPGNYSEKPKTRPTPLDLQEAVGKDLEKLAKPRHLERMKQIYDDCVVSTVVLTVKNEKSVKIALDSRKRNDT